MTVRRRRKHHKLLGQRTHGRGNTKKGRGAGVRGGRGRAGSHKHRYSKFYMVFGTEKKKIKGKEKMPAINLEQLEQNLDEWAKEGKVEKHASGFVIDGKRIGYSKILGKGTVKEKLTIRNMKASKQAGEKIIKAKGTIEKSLQETGKTAAGRENKGAD